MFVERSEKKAYDYSGWLTRAVQQTIDKGGVVGNVVYGKVFDHSLVCPRVFSALSQRFVEFTLSSTDTRPQLQFIWNPVKLKTLVGEVDFARTIVNGEIYCGLVGTTPLRMSAAGVIYSETKGDTTLYGTIEELLEIDPLKAPVDSVELNVMGKNIPMGLVLGYYYGFSNLVRKLGATVRYVSRGGRLDLQPDEYAIQFQDQTAIFTRHDAKATLIFGSLRNYEKAIANFNLDEFNRKDVYGAVMDRAGLGARYIRELDLLFSLWIDHITEELLKDMGEPTDLENLLIRAVELLTNDAHPRTGDGAYRRERGYERIPAAAFAELLRGVRRYKSRPLTAKARVEINPNDVWRRIQSDPSVAIVEQSNPIHNLKEKENVTFGGTGGRSGRSMVKSTRKFDRNDMGVISEAGVDSADVAVTTFFSPNPQLKNLRGVRKSDPVDLTNVGSMLSTTALIAPCIDRDD
jgi:hypothetical protein